MPIITLTSGIGCDLEAVAELVAKEMQLPLLNDQILMEEAEKLGFNPDESREFLKEKNPGFINRQMTNKPKVYLDMMEAVVFEAARKGKGVIMGHASQMLLHDFKGVLHVRLFASEEKRCRYMMEHQSMSEESAKKVIHKSDNEKRGFMHFAFHKDGDDLSLYDLVINLDKLENKVAVKLIIEASKAEEIKAGMVNMEERLEKKAALKLVEAALLKAKISQRVTISAEDKSIITVTGFADSKEDKAEIISIIKAVPGIKDVIDEIAIFPVGSGV